MKKFTSRILAITLAASLLPTPVFADTNTVSENDVTDEQSIEETKGEVQISDNLFDLNVANASDDDFTQIILAESPRDVKAWFSTLSDTDRETLLSGVNVFTSSYDVYTKEEDGTLTPTHYASYYDYLNQIPDTLNDQYFANKSFSYRIDWKKDGEDYEWNANQTSHKDYGNTYITVKTLVTQSTFPPSTSLQYTVSNMVTQGFDVTLTKSYEVSNAMICDFKFTKQQGFKLVATYPGTNVSLHDKILLPTDDINGNREVYTGNDKYYEQTTEQGSLAISLENCGLTFQDNMPNQPIHTSTIQGAVIDIQTQYMFVEWCQDRIISQDYNYDYPRFYQLDNDGNKTYIYWSIEPWGQGLAKPLLEEKRGYTLESCAPQAFDYDEYVAAEPGRPSTAYTIKYPHNYNFYNMSSSNNRIKPVPIELLPETIKNSPGYQIGNVSNDKVYMMWKDYGRKYPIVSVRRTYKPNTYTISYQGNGGTFSAATAQATYDSNPPAAPTVKTTPVGYSFDKWSWEGYTGSGLYKYDGDSIATAQWKPNVYTITYDPNGGTVETSSQSVTYDAECPKAPVATRKGYTLSGWSGGTYSGIYKTAGDTTVTAQWTPNTYKMIYQPGGGKIEGAGADGNKQVSVTFDADIPKSPIATKTGYTFTEWEGGVVTGKYTTDSDTTVTAKYRPNTYTVKFALAGGRINAKATVDDATATYDEAISLPGEPVKKNYEFAGWSDGAYAYEPGTDIKNLTTEDGGEVTLTALYNPVQYTITLDPGDGTLPTGVENTITFTAEEDITLPTPVKEPHAGVQSGKKGTFSYTFASWADEDGYPYTSTGDVKKSLTLHAVYNELFTPTITNYTITFDAGAGVADAESTLTDDEGHITLPNVTRDGYKLIGWFTDKVEGERVTTNTVFEQAQTIYALWEKISSGDPTPLPSPNPNPSGDVISDQETEQAATKIAESFGITEDQAKVLVDAIIAAIEKAADQRQIIEAITDKNATQEQKELLQTLIQNAQIDKEDKEALKKVADQSSSTNEENNKPSTTPATTPATATPTPTSVTPTPTSVTTPTPTETTGEQKTKAVTLGKVKSVKVKKNKGKYKITWKKDKNAKKYEVQYADNKSFKKAKSKKTSKLTATLKLKAGKTWYVRVRALNGNQNGKWSGKKKIKVK